MRDIHDTYSSASALSSFHGAFFRRRVFITQLRSDIDDGRIVNNVTLIGMISFRNISYQHFYDINLSSYEFKTMALISRN